MKTIVTMATLYGRRKTAALTLRSIAPQADKVVVVLNVTHHREPLTEWATELQVADNITFIKSDNTLGDAERYLPVKRDKCYYLSIDDDLVYPPSYVEYMTTQCQRYGHPVTLHGRFFNVPSVQSYYREAWGENSKAVNVYRCRYEVSHDAQVHVPGSGVLCWRGDQVDLRYRGFKGKNRADIEVARLAVEQGVEIKVLAHPCGWLEYNEPGTITIFDEKCWNDEPETEMVNEVIRMHRERNNNQKTMK